MFIRIISKTLAKINIDIDTAIIKCCTRYSNIKSHHALCYVTIYMLNFVSLNILMALHGHLALSAFQSLSCYCNQKVMSSDASQHVSLIRSNSWIV